MNLQHTFASAKIWEPLYQWEAAAHPVEIELFRSQPVRRLKYLHHFGASALFSPMVHSRFEHTVGVWSLMAHFFPDEELLRVAALLHDIGHLPFSHAIERTLGFDHHSLTEQRIQHGDVADILNRHGIPPASIISILEQESPLTNKTALMGLDHLDSFLRDTYAAGKHLMPPSELVKGLRFNGNFLEAESDIALPLVHAVVEDHRIFLQPEFLAIDALLAKAVAHHCDATPGMRERVHTLMDHELIQELQQSSDATARNIMHVLMYEPHRIQILNSPEPGSIQVQIHKLYKKQPLIGGIPAAEADSSAALKLAEMDLLTGSYFFMI